MTWSRVARIDVGQVVGEVADRTGVRLEVEGLCVGGEVGAAYVRWADGRRSILKWRPGIDLADYEAGPLTVAEAARSAGLPAPRTELAVQLDAAVATVQQLLPGAPITTLDEGLLSQALDVNQSLRHLLTDHPEVPTLDLYLTVDGPGFCLHGPLRSHNPRTTRLDDWITDVGAAHPGPLRGDDAVHVDFHPGNLLAVDGQLTGIIDWDGAGRGDHRLDLVTLRFGLHGQQPDPRVIAHLDAILDEIPPDALRPLWAHMSLRMTDWAIRHFSPADVDHWSALAESRTD
ncbi:aminoglycoside phosphotransferase family protein [Kribbella antibiotica]|uniref:Aminoglycoside phosphotransferase family protein n=1 Tax=Kribbella antibiotica TaxID=190195 RepID=A0A4R4ZUS1_9ACTN|nr:phosphotransferase [Kribbella antibiotica]TDD62893.1 aminoglycoside phosphotransferase family protein [Kribbella antibiotica]